MLRQHRAAPGSRRHARHLAVRRGDQRHHPPPARQRLHVDDEPLLRRYAGARQPAASHERPRNPGGCPGLAVGDRSDFRSGCAPGTAYTAATLIADDIEALAEQLAKFRDGGRKSGRPVNRGLFTLGSGDQGDFHRRLLGNHDDLCAALPDALKRCPRAFHAADERRGASGRSADGGRRRRQSLRRARSPRSTNPWSGGERRTLAILRRAHRLPGLAPPVSAGPADRLPPAGASRRGIAAPSCVHSGRRSCRKPSGTAPSLLREGRAQVYLDVSGSMNAEMPLLLILLSRQVSGMFAARSGPSAMW